MISSAETACAGKIGVLYLAALAPSSSLFAFAAEMCFAMSIVVEHHREGGGGQSRAGFEEEEEEAAKRRNTITAAVAASFVSGAVLACALASPVPS